MVDLGCQNTDWVGGDDIDILETNSLPDRLILAMSSLNKGKCGHVRCISGWFEVLRGASRVTDG